MHFRTSRNKAYLSVLLRQAKVAQSDMGPAGSGDCGFDFHGVWQYSFIEIDLEIFSTVILSFPLIQGGHLSVSGKRLHKYWVAT